MAMRILMTGATGFIGSHLVEQWHNQGHQLVILTRNPQQTLKRWPWVFAVASPSQLQGSFHGLINLAGAGIADQRWSSRRKRELWESRVELTQQLVAWAKSSQQRFEWVLSGSAVGYYGSTPKAQNDAAAYSEDSVAGDDYAAQLCRSWELSAQGFDRCAKRLLILRTGIVLGLSGGMLARMRLPFRVGLGCVLGEGSQVLSWVHLADYCRAVNFLIESNMHGPINMVAPTPVTNKEFTEEFAQVLGKSVYLRAPEFVLKLLLGEMSSLLLKGQKVSPDRLLKAGFEFQFPQLKPALEQIVCAS